jgi:hypothetical protein
MAQLAALGVEPGDWGSVAKSIATLENELDEEKVAREKAQANAKTLTWAVEELKKTTHQLTAQVPTLEDQVKHMDNKILNLLTKLWAKELCLQRTTAANDDLPCQGTRLTKKLESMYLFLLSHESYASIGMLLAPLQPHKNWSRTPYPEGYGGECGGFLLSPWLCLGHPSSATLWWFADSVLRGYPYQHEAVGKLNPQDPEVTLPPV